MKNNKGLIIGIIGLIIVMIGGTYAYYRWNSTSNINVSVKVSGNTVTFVGGSNVTGTLTPVDSKEEGIKKDITVKANEAGSTMSLYMELTTMPSELKEESFVYELYYNDTTLVKKGNFKAYNASNINKATKEIRLHFYDIGYEIHRDGKQLWEMNASERKKLIKILESKNDGITVWKRLIRAFNKNVKPQYIIDENILIPDYTLMRW